MNIYIAEYMMEYHHFFNKIDVKINDIVVILVNIIFVGNFFLILMYDYFRSQQPKNPILNVGPL